MHCNCMTTDCYSLLNNAEIVQKNLIVQNYKTMNVNCLVIAPNYLKLIYGIPKITVGVK